MKAIGIIVNPVAGLGGPLALKGSDQLAVAPDHLQHASDRAVRALSFLKPLAERVHFVTCRGSMGENALYQAGLDGEILPLAVGLPTTPQMTTDAARALLNRNVDLIVFAGGDGTARDVVEVVGQSIAVLGIPSGVKMHSGVFATTPESAGRLLRDVVEGCEHIRLRTSEVMDIDEAQLMSGGLAARLFGYALTPFERHLVQHAKARGFGDDDADLRGAARDIVAAMRPGLTYFIGPGTTAKLTLAELALKGTLLGVDAVRDGKTIGIDLDATAIRKLSREGGFRIILGVTGGQGFVFGRGNQQIPADVIRNAGWENMIILAGASKLARLDGGRLFVDTGDPPTDCALSGYIRVHTGPGRFAMVRVSS